jgi:hypothetical protein
MEAIIDPAKRWLMLHPMLASVVIAGAALLGSSRVRGAFLSVVGQAYCFFYPQDQSAVWLYPENADNAISMGRSSRFAKPPQELRQLAREKGVTYDELLKSAVDDCSIRPVKGDLVKCWGFMFVWADGYLQKDELEG